MPHVYNSDNKLYKYYEFQKIHLEQRLDEPTTGSTCEQMSKKGAQNENLHNLG